VDYEIILNDPRDISQHYGRVGCPNDGLRVLAKLIARHILAERWGNSLYDDAKKSTARSYYRSDLEDLY